MNEYQEFLKQKQKAKEHKGFAALPMNDKLFPFQQFIVEHNLSKGKHAVFADCGLGKTVMELETASQIVRHTNKPVLILAPLVVVAQTQREAEKFGFDLDKVTITNFENLHNINPLEYAGLIVDESSIMKNFEGQIKKQLFKYFHNTPYKFAFTATPSPNDPMELANHSEFLGYQSRLGMLATYFINDQDHTSKWRLKGHADKIFWQWMASWCVFIDNPNSLGYEIEGYKLPKLNIFEIIADGTDFSNDKLTLTQRRNVRKETLNIRCQKAADIVNSSDEQWLIWCSLNDESAKLKEYINESYEVKGSDNSKYKAETMIKFSNNEIKSLVTKPSIAGFGMNWQQCNNMIFVGLSDSYEQYYQAIRRCWRFGQTKEVNVYIILSAKEGTVKENIARKEEDAKYMQSQMVELTKEITQKELHSTSRIVTEYIPQIEMILPKLEEMKCKL